ncbi:Hypothetical predicted protein [Mytilus galloprovincialis]|uniref:Uncharacterized protein n=1 Tax=Mytilus galloprovincialis TaxID=29158 RepID=A0A8B6DRR5_MYTGA|nr:Hypothetical predicted protein [Mytilus galloprovincialis]
MISQEAIYYVKCLTHLYNRARPLKISDESSDNRIHGIVFAELLMYIEESRIDSDVIPIFKLADLTRMYTSRMEQFGLETSARVHSTDLQNRILAAIPDLQAHKQGRDVLLLYNDDVGAAIKQATRTNYDDEAILLSKAAQIVRKDMMAMQYIFNGTFKTGCQQNSVPQSWKTLVGMILGGPNIKMQSSNSIEAQTTLTISQLLQFNSSIRRRKDSSTVFHSTEREPPLPIYLGLLLHAETRKRIMNLSTALGNSICEAFNIENVVCPAKLRSGVFTTAAVDNIDHNPSSTTTKGSLHGTAISLFQHPVPGNVGVERLTIPIDSTVSKRENLKPLPKAYTIVPPVVLPTEPA